MKIFLGYPSEHESTAWEVYGFLKSAGDDVWFDKVSLIAGTDWDKEREKGQREADLVVHLCSEAILKRAGVVNREINQTLRLVEDQPLGSLYVIPIRLEPIKMPVELTRFQYFDFGDGWQERLSEGAEKRRAQLSGEVPETPKPPQITEEKPLPGLQKGEFEDITDAYECRGEYLRYDEEGLYWTFVNGPWPRNRSKASMTRDMTSERFSMTTALRTKTGLSTNGLSAPKRSSGLATWSRPASIITSATHGRHTRTTTSPP